MSWCLRFVFRERQPSAPMLVCEAVASPLPCCCCSFQHCLPSATRDNTCIFGTSAGDNACPACLYACRRRRLANLPPVRASVCRALLLAPYCRNTHSTDSQTSELPSETSARAPSNRAPTLISSSQETSPNTLPAVLRRHQASWYVPC